ncbi:MAG: aminodeoxychorismate synthase, component I [Gammaproteobacteria bacterium]|nr:MAG: aminodeoxychorismate synthase, component I [Gammaproteobacteria bacterium]
MTTTLLTFKENLKPQQLFAHFSDQPWAFWLDSCDSEHQDCQVDIMVFQPTITLTTTAKNTVINHFDQHQKLIKTQISTDDPLSLVDHYRQQVFAQYQLPARQLLEQSLEQPLPFIGGALGYFAYDLGRQFEVLPDTAKQDIDLPDMAIGIYQQAIIYNHKNQQYWLVCPSNIQATLTEFIDNLVQSPLLPKAAFNISNAWQSNIDKKAYQKKFKQVQHYLLSGDCYQINLAQRFMAQYQGNEFQAYLALRAANNAPFSAFMRFKNSVILSVSPERFLKVNQQGKVQSKPIKGTRPRSNSPQLDKKYANELKNAVKDQAENLMIVDLLRNDLSKTCVAGSVKVPKLFDIESFPAVHHLVSTVEGVLSADKNASDLLRGAFPGGSITGAPKIRAMEIIEQLEPHKRSVYCGSIGYISACGNMDTSITIRTLVCKPEVENTNKIYCWAGGGLVADSEVASEYQETFDKVNKILPVLADLNG